MASVCIHKTSQVDRHRKYSCRGFGVWRFYFEFLCISWRRGNAYSGHVAMLSDLYVCMSVHLGGANKEDRQC